MSLPHTSEPPMPPSGSGKGVTTLTLVVATTPVSRPHHSKPLLGIGLNGTLPWPRIKADMAFFARVTSRPPSSSVSVTAGGNSTKINAIIMGRKTYYSLPKSLRPLKDRMNVVISRDTTGSVAEEVAKDLARQKEKSRNNVTKVQSDNDNPAIGSVKEDKRDAFVSHSLEAAIDQLTHRDNVGKIFVIGGGEIYNSALNLSSSSLASTLKSRIGDKVILRILMTRVKKQDGGEYECDTIFPLTDEDLSSTNGTWREVGPAEMESWVGEPVTGDWIEEGEVAIKIEGYERIISLEN